MSSVFAPSAAEKFAATRPEQPAPTTSTSVSIVSTISLSLMVGASPSQSALLDCGVFSSLEASFLSDEVGAAHPARPNAAAAPAASDPAINPRRSIDVSIDIVSPFPLQEFICRRDHFVRESRLPPPCLLQPFGLT